MAAQTSSDTSLDELEAIYGDDYVDVTEGVQCYENGKTFTCECGQGIGVEHDVPAVKCASCKRMVVDREAEERGPPDRDEGQTGLSEWT